MSLVEHSTTLDPSAHPEAFCQMWHWVSRLEYLFYCSSFVFIGGGFVLYTSSRSVALAQSAVEGSATSQLILAFFYAVSTLLLVVRQDGRKVLRYAWPVLLLPMLAVTSVFWSPDPMLTLRRAVAFAGTILFGLSLGAAYGYRDTIRLVVVSMCGVLALSIVLVLLDPVMGIHQSNDVIQAVHAGSWRGIFAHRNTLGLWTGASLVLLVIAGLSLLTSWSVFLALVMASLIVLIKTGSSAGIAIVALSMICFFALATIYEQPRKLQSTVALLWVLLACLAYLTFEEIRNYSLWLLERDSNLSGRTELWSYIASLMQAADRPLGWGYFVGTILLDQRLSAATHIRNVNAHNGFVEAYVYFGWIGVVLSLSLVAWLFHGTIRLLKQELRHNRALAYVPAIMLLLVVIHNMVESTIVSPNNLNNVLISVIAAMIARGGRSIARG